MANARCSAFTWTPLSPGFSVVPGAPVAGLVVAVVVDVVGSVAVLEVSIVGRGELLLKTPAAASAAIRKAKATGWNEYAPLDEATQLDRERRRRPRVVVIERDARANGASIRNFGFVTVTGQQRGQCWQRAMRSRQVWAEVAPAAGIVERLNCGLGALVSAGQRLVTLRGEVAV